MIRRGIQGIGRGVRRFFRAHYEQLRTLLLLALVIGVLAQSRALWLRALDSGSGGSTAAGTQMDSSACALPIRFAVRGEDGLYGMQYNTNGMQQAYDLTADVWAQALANAGTPTVSNTADYRAALRQEMLLMAYDGTVPLYALAAWLGCELPEALENDSLGTIALCCGDNFNYSLFIRDGETGSLWEIPTSVDTTAFNTTLAQFGENDCELAADGEDEGISPDTLYFPGGETFEVVSFNSYDGTDGWEDILTAFGLDADSAMASAYTSDSASVYVSGSHTVRLAQDGTMRYDGSTLHAGVGDDDASDDVRVQCIQSGYELTCSVLDALSSGASAALTDAYYEQDTGRYIAVFGLQIGGVPVDNDVTGYFARYEFEGDVLARATLALRTSQTTSETIAIMPEKQVAASLESAVDTQLSLRYTDEAAGSQWTDTDSSGELWEEEDTDGVWTDELDEAEDSDSEDDSVVPEYGTSWYDTTGTPVSPRWYALHYDTVASTADSGNDARESREITIVRADFDELIRGGGAA